MSIAEEFNPVPNFEKNDNDDHCLETLFSYVPFNFAAMLCEHLIPPS